MDIWIKNTRALNYYQKQSCDYVNQSFLFKYALLPDGVL